MLLSTLTNHPDPAGMSRNWDSRRDSACGMGGASWRDRPTSQSPPAGGFRGASSSPDSSCNAKQAMTALEPGMFGFFKNNKGMAPLALANASSSFPRAVEEEEMDHPVLIRAVKDGIVEYNVVSTIPLFHFQSSRCNHLLQVSRRRIAPGSSTEHTLTSIAGNHLGQEVAGLQIQRPRQGHAGACAHPDGCKPRYCVQGQRLEPPVVRAFAACWRGLPSAEVYFLR